MDGGLTLGITMTLIPRMGSPETLAELLLDELKKRNITYGIDEAAILRIMQDRVVNEEVVIAHGTPPRSGSDAEVQMLLLPPSFMAASDDKGQIDYKNIENVSEVKAGDVIARKTPADPGEPGFNIFGREVRPAPVRDAKLPIGRNAVLSDDGLELRAAKDGFLRWKADKIEVVELFLVMGDVGPRTGNIHYQNEVEIHGDVQAGFEVVAGGDVQVFGAVDGGKVVSEQGKVTVWRGVMGSSEGPGVISALSDVQIGRARFAKIESKTGNVTANSAVEHSEIKAAGDLSLLAGPAMNCVIEVGGKVDIVSVTTERERPTMGEPEVHDARLGNRRAYVRALMSTPVPVQLMRDQASQTVQGEILDLSGGGMKVRLEGRLRDEDTFRTQFKLPGIEGTMWMDAQVARTVPPLDPEHPDPKRSYGLKFTQIEPAVRDTIAKFCLGEDLKQRRLTG